MFLPAAALGSPGQSAHSAACENASCPFLWAARKRNDVNFSYPLWLQGLKSTQELLVAEARHGSIKRSTLKSRAWACPAGSRQLTVPAHHSTSHKPQAYLSSSAASESPWHRLFCVWPRLIWGVRLTGIQSIALWLLEQRLSTLQRKGKKSKCIISNGWNQP